ncbi:MAG: VOC family protein [Gemmataceae bacterium]|nr:VOC family protein [Gemmataceae bacterium]
MGVKVIPDGYHSVTVYLIIQGAAKALDYYKEAFGATELFRIPGPGDTVGHAEIKIGDSIIMLADECPAWGNKSPTALGGSPTGICLYVDDADAVFDRAVAAGGTVKKPIENQFYGDRSGSIVDPFGHVWTVATHVEDVSPEELNRRMAEFTAAAQAAA